MKFFQEEKRFKDLSPQITQITQIIKKMPTNYKNWPTNYTN